MTLSTSDLTIDARRTALMLMDFHPARDTGPALLRDRRRLQLTHYTGDLNRMPV
jgi:hypothetical protein